MAEKRQPIPDGSAMIAPRRLSVLFSALFLLPFRRVFLAMARVSAAYLPMPNTRHGANGILRLFTIVENDQIIFCACWLKTKFA